MSIYVDDLIAYGQKATSGGRHFGSGKQSCHMATDGDIEELHIFAEKIGLKRAWFQDHKSMPHYDLTPSRRAAAVRADAIEVMRRCGLRYKQQAPEMPPEATSDVVRDTGYTVTPEGPHYRLVRRPSQRITSEYFDPQVMLAKAYAGAYPAAAHSSDKRVGEIAHWQQRCRDQGLAFDEYTPQPKDQPIAAVRAACEAWEAGGGQMLALWLAGYKEQTTKSRTYTTEEYGEWVRIVKRDAVSEGKRLTGGGK